AAHPTRGELRPHPTLTGVLLIGNIARSLRAFHREEPAQTLIEFAIVLPIFLLVITGLMDTARAVWETNTLAYSAREGTRYAIVHGSGGNPRVGPVSNATNPSVFNTGNIVTVVRNAAIGVPGVNVTIDYPDLNTERTPKVTV